MAEVCWHTWCDGCSCPCHPERTYICGACMRTVAGDMRAHNERFHGAPRWVTAPKTYASLPVETRRRVVDEYGWVLGLAEVLREETTDWPKAARMDAAAARLEEYIVGEKA